MQPANKRTVQDPADSYERAHPANESPGGQLDLPKPPPENEPDHLQEQNKAPIEKPPTQKRMGGESDR